MQMFYGGIIPQRGLHTALASLTIDIFILGKQPVLASKPNQLLPVVSPVDVSPPDFFDLESPMSLGV